MFNSLLKCFGVVSALGICIASPALAQGRVTVTDVASTVDDLSTFVKALEAVDLDEELMGTGPFTVFIPTDDAFEDFNSILESRYGLGVSELIEPANQDLLSETLSHHIIQNSAIFSENIPDGETFLEASSGETVQVNRSESSIAVGGSDILAFDLLASNGVIHIIDDVLFPPDVVADLENNRANPAVSSTDETIETISTDEAIAPEPIRGLW